MGFGECTRKIERTSRARKREDARRCCRSFQWNFGSGVAAMFCWGVSATFKVTNVVLSELEPISKKRGDFQSLIVQILDGDFVLVDITFMIIPIRNLESLLTPEHHRVLRSEMNLYVRSMVMDKCSTNTYKPRASTSPESPRCRDVRFQAGSPWPPSKQSSESSQLGATSNATGNRSCGSVGTATQPLCTLLGPVSSFLDTLPTRRPWI